MCGVGLDPQTGVGHSSRQVFDLPLPQPLVVTEHRAHDCQCPACGAKTRAPFPDGVNAPVQYGARITAFVIYLLHYQLLPENRLATLMADLFGVKVAAATIARMSRTCAERLQDFVETVRDLVAGAPVKHTDETGFRIGGKTQWLHVASTTLLTFYRVCAKRGSLLANVVGVVVHDHWKPYYTIEGVLHALPLRFANPSPPSGWIEDFHLQAVDHARHTKKSPGSWGSFIPVAPWQRERLLGLGNGSAVPVAGGRG